jgi:hypothetical protein
MPVHSKYSRLCSLGELRFRLGAVPNLGRLIHIGIHRCACDGAVLVVHNGGGVEGRRSRVCGKRVGGEGEGENEKGELEFVHRALLAHKDGLHWRILAAFSRAPLRIVRTGCTMFLLYDT